MVNYDAYATTFSNSRKNLKWPELEYIITDMISHGSTNVLDIGCGNGRFLEPITNYQLPITNYLGLDSSAGMIAEAKNLHPDYAFAVCPMESLLNYPAIQLSSYPAILFLASFHHLETRAERIQVLEDMKSLIAPR